MTEVRVYQQRQRHHRYYVVIHRVQQFLKPHRDWPVRACLRAGVEPFVPYDLRRSMATRARVTLGKEAAKVLLGHASTSTTEIYLLEEVKEAMKVAKALSS